ncbi:MAG: hypothetical protein IT442_07415 [Phycisphaeraceae bacterium]|nr:hypothetical protein [Phycisphaeraceae bacterium]
MKSLAPVRALFALVGLYDLVGGAALLFWANELYAESGVVPPRHMAYARFPGAMVITFGLMALAIAWRPLANRNLIPFTLLAKICVVVMIFYYWWASGIKDVWKPVAFVDVVLVVLMALAWGAACKASRQTVAAA